MNESNNIDNSTVDKLSDLAKLDFDPSEKTEIISHLNRILKFIDKLNELDTQHIEPLIYLTDESNVLREDEVKNEIPQKEALKNGPKHDSDYFRIQKVKIR